MNTTSEAIPYQHEADAFDARAAVGRLRDAIFGHLLLIAVTCIACFALVGVYLKAFPPIYKASVTVYGDPKDDTARSGYYQVWNIFRGDDLKSEPALVTSRAVPKITALR